MDPKTTGLAKQRQEASESTKHAQPSNRSAWGSLTPDNFAQVAKSVRNPDLQRLEDKGAIGLILKVSDSDKERKMVKDHTARFTTILAKSHYPGELLLAESTAPANPLLSRAQAISMDIQQEGLKGRSTVTIVAGFMEDAVDSAFEKLEVWTIEDEHAAMQEVSTDAKLGPSGSNDTTEPVSMQSLQIGGDHSRLTHRGLREVMEWVVESLQRLGEFGLLGETWKKTEAKKMIWKIVASTNAMILEGLVTGTLCRSYHTNRHAKEILDGLTTHVKATTKKKGQPSIYANVFADRWGNALTIGDIHRILDTIEIYAFRTDVPPTHPHVQVAIAIDGIQEKLQAGTREKSQPPTTRHLVIEDTCPDRYPTPDITTRFRKHRKHDESSHTIMNLFQAVSIHLFDDRYVLHQFVLFPIWEEDQAALAEKIFTILTKASIKESGGFAYHPAGQSVNSISKVTEAEWSQYVEFALRNTPYVRNDRMESERILRLEEKRKWLLETLEEATKVLTRTVEQHRVHTS
ncbi:hypothetical protein K491DRAFT_722096 [Lophiostoma macrostomum CBS 122681]|uniref:Uncharacterized protein n=1 Tax=Lophiostoma macrostomum CBS 122681 TaxID=1314788 RepID=A0A6A6SM72_9PLEO|nr:hypothetical protein K491DRAFT_722096 [Lophiostoma macrostomum CBS 122681]